MDLETGVYQNRAKVSLGVRNIHKTCINFWSSLCFSDILSETQFVFFCSKVVLFFCCRWIHGRQCWLWPIRVLVLCMEIWALHLYTCIKAHLLGKIFNTQRPMKRFMVFCPLCSGHSLWFLCLNTFLLCSKLMIMVKEGHLLCTRCCVDMPESAHSPISNWQMRNFLNTRRTTKNCAILGWDQAWSLCWRGTGFYKGFCLCWLWLGLAWLLVMVCLHQLFLVYYMCF